jgi:thiamine pyrophosphokinase
VVRVAIVLAGGDPIDAVAPRLRTLLPDDAFVIAADSGLALADTLDLHVDLVVGDMDSVAPVSLTAAEAKGARVERHPAEKDATDLELALLAAQRHGIERVALVGGAGGRVDHFLANVALLTATRFADLAIDAYLGDAVVRVVRGVDPPLAVGGAVGEVVSLLPVGGDAHGVTTAELRYPLCGEDLPIGTTRGISNVVEGASPSVRLERGMLLVVRPGRAS